MANLKQYLIPGIYREGKKIYTKGDKLFLDRIIKRDGELFREFDPKRSKLAATIVKGCKKIGIRLHDTILYLGVSHGYTASHISNIIGDKGLLFGVDPAPRVMRDFYFLCKEKNNLIPILADANKPEEYEQRIFEVDTIIQDIAQKNQAEIFLKNCKLFLKKGGFGLLSVKARSVDVTKKPKFIFKEVENKIRKELDVLEIILLDPLEKDHCMIICRKHE